MARWTHGSDKNVMKIKKGTLLDVKHSRSGNWRGIATEDFDTDVEEFYPIALAQKKEIVGMNVNNVWQEGGKMPCRNTLCKISVAEG